MGRLFRIALVVVVLGLVGIVPAQGADPNLIENGSFEAGFVNGVGKGWTAFNNGGHCSYNFGPDDWKPVVWDGRASQLIAIRTDGVEGDRYAGISQAVKVQPGTTYRLTIHGMVRSSDGSVAASGYGYRVQWAVDYSGGTDWQKVAPEAWQELDWYEWPHLSSGYLETFSTEIKATSSELVLFMRAWKKWPTADTLGEYNLDGISLVSTAEGGARPGSGGELPPTGVALLMPAVAAVLAAVVLAARGLRAYRWRMW